MAQPTKDNQTIINELYAETTSEQVMIFAIRAHNHIQVPNQKKVTHVLSSYDEDYTHSTMYAAIYGFRAIHKKRVIFLIPTQDDTVKIQNPQKFSSIAKSYKSAIHKSPYYISQNNRIYPGITKHMQYLGLLTQITQMSIIHIPTTQIFQESIHSYLQSLVDQETMFIYCSNIDPQQENQTHDILMHKLREHMTQDTEKETLEYKNDVTNTINTTSNYLHIGA